MTTTTNQTTDGAILVNGAKCRITHRTTKPGRPAGLWFKQRIVTETRRITSGDDKGCYIRAEIRFDDECGNGHNTFAITGEINKSREFTKRGFVSGGCLHEDIAAHFPELAHLIKWHLCSTDSPMHYVSNTVFHAGDRDRNGKRKGEPTRFETIFRFDDFPITFEPKRVLKEWLISKQGKDIHDFEFVITPVPHREKGIPGKYQFEDKYSFAGCESVVNPAVNWTYAPFDSIRQAEEWRDAIKRGYSFENVAVAWSEGKARDFDAARNSGIWPDATDEQLSVEPEELKAALLERLPALIDAMKADITGAGFLWSAE